MNHGSGTECTADSVEPLLSMSPQLVSTDMTTAIRGRSSAHSCNKKEDS